MSYRIGLVGDVHLSYRAPSTRKDDYLYTVLKKLIWVGKKCEELKVDLCLFTGDMFHRKEEPYITIRGMIKALKSFPDFTGVRVVCGSHDVRGGVGNIASRPLGILEAAGIPVLTKDEKVGPVLICGSVHYNEELTSTTILDTYDIIITHLPITLTDKKLPFKHYVARDVLSRARPNTLWVNGHMHTEQGHFADAQGRVFIALGSISRTARDQASLIPTFFTFDWDTREVQSYVIPHLPFTEAFDLTIKDEPVPESWDALSETLHSATPPASLSFEGIVKNDPAYLNLTVPAQELISNIWNKGGVLERE